MLKMPPFRAADLSRAHNRSCRKSRQVCRCLPPSVCRVVSTTGTAPARASRAFAFVAVGVRFVFSAGERVCDVLESLVRFQLGPV